MNIQKFYSDHAELVAIVHRVERAMEAQERGAALDPLAEAVQELFGRCGIHLALEDSTLYPNLRKHESAAVRETSQRFETEMGGIKAALEAYRHKWPGKIAIAKNPAAFAAETRQILAALKDRIARENTILYPLVERA